jgi:hypothetical protein
MHQLILMELGNRRVSLKNIVDDYQLVGVELLVNIKRAMQCGFKG